MDPRLITRCRQSSRGRHDDRRGGPRRDSLTKRGAAGGSGHLSSLRAFCFCFAFFGISQLGGKEERLKGNKVGKKVALSQSSQSRATSQTQRSRSSEERDVEEARL